MEAANKNTKDAVKELGSAQKHQKKAGCCQRFLICIIFLGLIITGVIIYFAFFHDKKK